MLFATPCAPRLILSPVAFIRSTSQLEPPFTATQSSPTWIEKSWIYPRKCRSHLRFWGYRQQTRTRHQHSLNNSRTIGLVTKCWSRVLVRQGKVLHLPAVVDATGFVETVIIKQLNNIVMNWHIVAFYILNTPPTLALSAITARVSTLLYDDSLYVNGLCRPSKHSFGTNIRIVDIHIQKSHSTPFVLLGNEQQYDVDFDNVRVVDTPSDVFPCSNERACYNASICDNVTCKRKGDRDPVVPCCDDYDPLSGGYWGKCIDYFSIMVFVI